MRLTAIIASLMMFCCASACTGESADYAAAEVRAVIPAYNAALSVALESLDMNRMNQVATPEQAEREYLFMAALGESRIRMLAEPVSIEFGEVTFPADNQASVTTTEIWDYEHVSLDTSETVRVETGVTYSLRYDLVLHGDQWLVDQVTDITQDSASGDF